MKKPTNLASYDNDEKYAHRLWSQLSLDEQFKSVADQAVEAVTYLQGLPASEDIEFVRIKSLGMRLRVREMLYCLGVLSNQLKIVESAGEWK